MNHHFPTPLVRIVAAIIGAAAILALCSQPASAEDNPLEPLDSSSPQATYVSFVDQVKVLEERLADYESNRAEATQKAFSAALGDFDDLFDFSEVAAANRVEVLAVSVTSLADILNRVPPPAVADIPDIDAVEEADAAEITLPGADGEFSARSSITGYTLPGTEIRITRIEEGERVGAYVFSARTVAQIPTWREEVEGLPVNEGVVVRDWVNVEANFTGHFVPRSVVDALPESFETIVLGSPLWKLVADIFILAGVGALTWAWRRFVARRGEPGTIRGYALRLTTPVVLIVSITLARRFMDEQLNHSGDVATVVNLLVTATVWLGFAWGFWIVARLAVELVIARSRSNSRLDAHLLRLIGKVVSVSGALVLAWTGLSRIGISTVGLGVGAGVLGLAIGLAATGTLENLIGGITVYADRPFAVGEMIRVDDDFGTVEEIGPRSTNIRKLDDTRVTLPNSDISRLKVINFSERRHIQFLHVVGVRYETTREQLRTIVEGIDEQFRAHPRVLDEVDTPRVVVTGFGASSIDIEVRARVETQDFPGFQRIQQELLLLIFEIVESAGSGFAFPSTTTYLADDTGLPAASQSAPT